MLPGLKAEVNAGYKEGVDGTPVAVIGSGISVRPSSLLRKESDWTWKGVVVWKRGLKLPDSEKYRGSSLSRLD